MGVLFQVLIFAILSSFLYIIWRILFSCWISPAGVYLKLKKNGFGGPTPNFPLGNHKEIKNISRAAAAAAAASSSSSSYTTTFSSSETSKISNDIHSSVFPYFSQWQKSHGKVFIYWLGTEPFLYIADPEFLRKMSSGVMGKSWGKPQVFKQDREPMFGNGLVMVEGDEWVRHRHVITPAFSPANLKAMSSLMVESTTKMLDKWAALINSGSREIDVEREITATAGEIIAKTSFGISYENGRKVFEKLRAMQITLFKSNRYVGVPFSKLMCPGKTLEAKKLGKEIDAILLTIVRARKSSNDRCGQKDLLGLLLQENGVDGRLGKMLTTRELVDECKTFFFGGHETTALALSWTLLLLARHPEWQNHLREEIRGVTGDKEIDFTKLAGLKKMGWVMNEVLRLYSPAPNVQRQAREDIQVDDLVIPNGTNMWIDVVAMHHDPKLWGDDVNEFKPERFKDDLYGGCKHKMGFLPFGFGGRMCIGRNLTMMEYKIVLTLVLTRFSFSISPSYSHSPAIVLSLRPSNGLPLIVTPL
ncbi:CYTOCHROME P450 FAMILY 72 PROTEIN [Salix purpurea]|uniref:CYTOCHROME P450 FAMILY 72 PROTEIN n=2 Tax=Salix TaxID=40685 RepID=A0A9Q0W627_SALPP|nr:CYTOCHROME P450 FAMILY 72 PROTEIN [Salix purpurea]